jgi:uncharacterized delta-60 repeat protein
MSTNARQHTLVYRMALVAALAGLASHVAWGGPGDVDPSFADGGFFTSEALSGSANSILAPGDATYIVSGGYTRGTFWAPQEIYTAGFLRRLTTAGTLDPVENLRGREVLATVLQPDQTIVGIARESRLLSWHDSAFRLQPDGTLDTGFGSGGWVELAFRGGGTSFRPRHLSLMSPALTVEPAGGITIAGSLGGDLLVSRVLPDGAFDGGFAVDGTYVGQALGPAQNSILRTPGGGYRLLTRDQLETGSRCRVLALTQGGAPDADFGSDGYADLETPAEGSVSCSNVIELADGRLLAVGTENGRAFAIRLLADGAVDPTFSSADIAETAGSLQKAVIDGKGWVCAGSGCAQLLQGRRGLGDHDPRVGFGSGGRRLRTGWRNGLMGGRRVGRQGGSATNRERCRRGRFRGIHRDTDQRDDGRDRCSIDCFDPYYGRRQFFTGGATTREFGNRRRRREDRMVIDDAHALFGHRSASRPLRDGA